MNGNRNVSVNMNMTPYDPERSYELHAMPVNVRVVERKPVSILEFLVLLKEE